MEEHLEQANKEIAQLQDYINNNLERDDVSEVHSHSSIMIPLRAAAKASVEATTPSKDNPKLAKALKNIATTYTAGGDSELPSSKNKEADSITFKECQGGHKFRAWWLAAKKKTRPQIVGLWVF